MSKTREIVPGTRPSSTAGMPAGFALALAIGAPAGWLLAWLKTPLPWLIGPLLACAIACSAGLPLRTPHAARSAGQWVIGATLGLYFTPAAVAHIGELWLPILAGVAWAIAIGLVNAWMIRRFADADPPTAFFAGAVGSASEMALQGERHGGRVEIIAAAHSLRILLVVVIVPYAFRWLGLHGSDVFTPVSSLVEPRSLAILVVTSILVTLVMRRLGSPNVWIMGPLLACVVLTATGTIATAMPAGLVKAGQVVIGVALGTRFSPGFFGRAPRILTVSFFATLAAIGLSALFGALLAWSGSLNPATMVLATSPGGIAEMSLTARVLGLGVPVVTIFHATRMAALVMFLAGIYRRLAAARGWPLEPAAPHVISEARTDG